jgi:hypothetical protein
MHVVYDDGAGLTKAGIAGNGMQVTAIPALVLPVEAGMDEEYLLRSDVIVIGHNRNQYLVGDAARAQGATAYATSNYRYTSPDARIRLYAALSELLPPGEHAIRMVAGANAEAYRALKRDIQDFFTGSHEFTRADASYRVNITDVHVTSQPRGAVLYFSAHTPAELKQALQKRPLHRANIIGIDVGTFTTDLIALRPERRADGSSEMQEIYRRSKALRFGVQTLRNKVAELIQRLQGAPGLPELWEVDRAIAERVVTIDGKDESIAPEIDDLRDSLWARAHEEIRAHFEGFSTHYLLVVGGGATDTTFGPSIRATWHGKLPMGMPEKHAPHEAPVRGYAEMAVQKWGRDNA